MSREPAVESSDSGSIRRSTTEKHSPGHRLRPTAILDVEGPNRVAFLHGQLTQDIRSMASGETRLAAGLTPKGKLIFLARVHALPDRLRLLLPASTREIVLAHLKKYAVFQKVSIVDSTDAFFRIGLYGATPSQEIPGGAILLPGEGEFAAEILAPTSMRAQIEGWLAARGSRVISEEEAEARRVEAGRPRFGQDADPSHLPDEVGLEEAISTTKGCYVGQEIVARMRTYGRANRRLVGFRFPKGAILAGALLKRPDETVPGKIEQGRVTSSVVSPRLGVIGLGYAFREVPVGGRLVAAEDPSREAVVEALPFA